MSANLCHQPPLYGCRVTMVAGIEAMCEPTAWSTSHQDWSCSHQSWIWKLSAVETDTEPLIWLHSLRRLVNDLVVGWLHQTPSTLEGVVIHSYQNWYYSRYRSAFNVHRASTRTSMEGCTKYLIFHMTLSQTKNSSHTRRCTNRLKTMGSMVWSMVHNPWSCTSPPWSSQPKRMVKCPVKLRYQFRDNILWLVVQSSRMQYMCWNNEPYMMLCPQKLECTELRIE